MRLHTFFVLWSIVAYEISCIVNLTCTIPFIHMDLHIVPFDSFTLVRFILFYFFPHLNPIIFLLFSNSSKANYQTLPRSPNFPLASTFLFFFSLRFTQLLLHASHVCTRRITQFISTNNSLDQQKSHNGSQLNWIVGNYIIYKTGNN